MAFRIPMLIRLLTVIGAVLFCYSYPSEYQHEFLQLDNLEENTARSLYLCLLVAVMWMERSALYIISIEALLILCNIYTSFYIKDGGGLLAAPYYSQLQLCAFVLELLIMFVFTIVELRRIGRAHSLSDFHGSMFPWRGSRGGSN